MVTNAMFTNMGYPGASSLLGGIVSSLSLLTYNSLFINVVLGRPPDTCAMAPNVFRAQNSRKEQARKCT